jgi:cysteine-rich repeat protein
VRRVTVLLCLIILTLPLLVQAATVKIVNHDGPNEGFNDTTPVAPVGGNTGTTRGAQRRNAFQFAADIWGARLDSAIEIRVDVEFNPLPCDAFSATLGSAGPNSVIRDFAHAPQAGVWFVQALANSLFGEDTDPEVDDIEADFNSSLGAPECLAGVQWYLGFDGKPPLDQIDFVTIALHELAHGLGFLELVNLQTGEKLLGLDDAFIRFLENQQTGKLYPEMIDSERVSASVATDKLLWTGEQTTVAAEKDALVQGVDEKTGQVKMYTPELPDPGSSVAHFSDELSPSELMSPFYLGPSHNVDLAVAAFADIGWQVMASASCGNGSLDLGETCDDNNRLDGDGCDHTCRVEACFSCAGEPSACTPEPSCGLSLDAFNCYQAQVAKGVPFFAPRKATLANEFTTENLTLVKPTHLCSPTHVNDAGVFDPTAHLTCYQAKGGMAQLGMTTREIQVANQFGGNQHLLLSRLQSLCLPSMTDNTPSPLKVDSYACYQAQETLDSPPIQWRNVQFSDSFATGVTAVRKAVNFCAPVTIGNKPIDLAASLTCYQLQKDRGAETSGNRTVIVENVLGAQQTLVTSGLGVLCVPSVKVGQ